MRTFWTKQEIKFITENYSEMKTADIATILNRPVTGVYGKAFTMGLKKSKEYITNLLSNEGKKLSEFGKNYQFKKENIPYNYGKKMPAEIYDKCKHTMFKKGNKPTNTKKKGDERKDVDGYTYVKIADKNWQLKHRLLWESVNGPIPAESIIIFKDKNIENFDIDNLQMISKVDNMLRNTIHNYPEPIKQLIKLNKKLKRKINEKQN